MNFDDNILCYMCFKPLPEVFSQLNSYLKKENRNICPEKNHLVYIATNFAMVAIFALLSDRVSLLI